MSAQDNHKDTTMELTNQLADPRIVDKPPRSQTACCGPDSSAQTTSSRISADHTVLHLVTTEQPWRIDRLPAPRLNQVLEASAVVLVHPGIAKVQKSDIGFLDGGVQLARDTTLYHKGVDEERSVRGDTRHSDSRDNLHTKQQNTGYVPTTL